MTSTTTPLPGAVSGAPGLDGRLVLEAIVERRRAADAAEADLLALAVHYVDLHPVTDTHPAATWVADRELTLPAGPVEVPLAGIGTPGVAEYAVEALGAALDLSYRSALGLVSEAVELCFRLPRLYQLVQTGRLQAWKARTVARETTRLSPAAVAFVDRHLAGHATIRPVLDLARTDAVDRHDPPDWIRDAVMLRDGHCVFPGCTLDARSCDLDHIEPYIPLDHGGPPGQTSTTNLACLCRRHHRLKTFTAWTYQRQPDGHYQWRNPHGLTYQSRPSPKR